MKKLSKKHRQILDTGKTLFWKFGIKRVTIEEICREANVSKVTFYKHFSNKNELAKTLITILVEEAIVRYDKIMAANLPYKEKAHEIIKMKMEGIEGVSKELIADIYMANDSELIAHITDLGNKNLARTISDYEKAQKDGDIRPDINPKFIIYFLGKAQEMIEDPSFTQMYDSTHDMVSELINFFFYGILSREK